MHEITSMEIGLLVRELRSAIEGSRLRKFYDLGKGAFKIAFYKSSETKLVYIKFLKTINLTGFSEPADDATPFAMSIRKRVENSVVDTVSQVNLDRIIRLDMDKGKYALIIEMYGKGNMLLVNSDGIIETAYRISTHGAHTVKSGVKYENPPSASQDLFTIADDKAAAISGGLAIEKNLIVALSRELNLGPLYLEDIIIRADLDPKAKSISTEGQKKLAEQIILFRERVLSEKPHIYLNEDGTVADYAVCGIKKYEGFERRESESISQLLDELYLGERSSVPDTAREQRLRELNLNIEKQEGLAKQLALDSEEFSKSGKLIFEKMNQINALCMYLRENRRTTLSEVSDAFPMLRVKELDLKNKTVVIMFKPE